MADRHNPYIAGAPVVEKCMFFGREGAFGWIEHSLSGKYVDHPGVLPPVFGPLIMLVPPAVAGASEAESFQVCWPHFGDGNL